MCASVRVCACVLECCLSDCDFFELQQKKTDSHSKEAQPNSTLQENAEAINVKEDDPDSAEAELPLEVRIERANQLIAA